MPTPIYKQIVRTLAAIASCNDRSNQAAADRHQDRLDTIMQTAPTGSGFDSGTQLADSSTPDRLIFTTDYHHMNEGGYYDGWTPHRVIITPSLQYDFTLQVTGRDRNQIKDYIEDTFNQWLTTEDTSTY